MSKKLIVAILLSLFVGAGMGYVISYAEISELNSKYEALREEYNDYVVAHSHSNSDYNELLARVEELNAEISELKAMPRWEFYILTDREYYYSLMSDIGRANESILVAMYSMVYDPDDPFDWANDLIRGLVYARERGVNVTVIIEYRTYWGYMDGNLNAYRYLSAHNVTVRLDEESDTDHMKLVIIDDKIVYIGSHNWSESALYYNHETSVKIISREIAEKLKAYFDTI